MVAMIVIRSIESSDWPAVWRIIEPVFRLGDTYSFATDISEEEAYNTWITKAAATYVALDSIGNILGTYYLKPNQPGHGAHVCNCGYIVAEQARGTGIATTMCSHSQDEAERMGFRAMRFNLVVSTNTTAVDLWRKLGFELVGTLPEAFWHPLQGYVDAYVMYKLLIANRS